MNFQLSDFGAEMVSIEQVEHSNSCRGCLVGHVNNRGSHHPTNPSLGTTRRRSPRPMPSWLGPATSNAKLLWPKPAVSPTTQIAGVSRHHLDAVGARCLLSGWWRSVARRVPVSMSTAVRFGSRRGFDSRRLHQFGPSGVESRHARIAHAAKRKAQLTLDSRSGARPGSFNFAIRANGGPADGLCGFESRRVAIHFHLQFSGAPSRLDANETGRARYHGRSLVDSNFPRRQPGSGDDSWLTGSVSARRRGI